LKKSITPTPSQPESRDLYVVEEPKQPSSGPKPSTKWGLTRCKPRWDCEICKVLQDDLGQHIYIRDLYTKGIDVWVLADVFQLPGRGLADHIRRKRWDRYRDNSNLQYRSEMQIRELLFARVRNTWAQSVDDSADKALAQLVKLDSIKKVAIKEESHITWEEIVREHN
jgi:hypothetical protein